MKYAIPTGTGEINHVDLSKKDIEELCERFRKANGTDEIIAKGGRDKAYERYCSQFYSSPEPYNTFSNDLKYEEIEIERKYQRLIKENSIHGQKN